LAFTIIFLSYKVYLNYIINNLEYKINNLLLFLSQTLTDIRKNAKIPLDVSILDREKEK